MKKLILSGTVAVTLIMLSSCAKVYRSEDSKELAKRHEVIAILPPAVSFKQTKDMEGQNIEEIERREAEAIHEEMYRWLEKRRRKKNVQLKILDVTTTIRELEAAGYPEKKLTKMEMAKIMRVDGFISTNFTLSKPMSEAGAVVTSVLVGFGGVTNSVKADISIYDVKQEKEIFNYFYQSGGGVGSDMSKLIDAMMKQASRKMPYFKK